MQQRHHVTSVRSRRRVAAQQLPSGDTAVCGEQVLGRLHGEQSSGGAHFLARPLGVTRDVDVQIHVDMNAFA